MAPGRTGTGQDGAGALGLAALVSVADFEGDASDPLDELVSLDVDPALSELDVDPSDGVLDELSELVVAFEDPPDRLSVL